MENIPALPNIYIGSDHAGFSLKVYIKEALIKDGFVVQDFGTMTEESFDYPDAVHPLVQAIEKNPAYGILICGSANGVCMTANKYPFIRAGIAWLPEIAALLRQHNDANIICLPARYISQQTALACVHTFLHTNFEGGRHSRRVEKITPF